MIVLPQGGVTRRAGFNHVGSTSTIGVKLIPFVYNTNDSVILEFGNHQVRVWGKSSASNIDYELRATFTSPYSSAYVKDLRYVQSGNVMFFSHKRYPPQMLKRYSAYSWAFQELEFEGGPWIDGSAITDGAKIISIVARDESETPTIRPTWVGRNETLRLYTLRIDQDFFDVSMVGSLIRVDFTVEGETQTFYSVLNGWTVSREFSVHGNFNVTTTGNWTGRVRIERSINNGENWTIIKEYRRTDTEAQGQIDYTIAEQDEDVLFRVRATHDLEDSDDMPETPTNGNNKQRDGEYYISTSTLYNAKDDTNTPLESHVTVGRTSLKKAIEVNITVSGYIKTQIYQIQRYLGTQSVAVNAVLRDYEVFIEEPEGFLSWSLGAWGGYQGYPGAVAMYQDRLVFASSYLEPQTIWFSRTGDYKNFAVADPIADDDAITITLSSRTADGIHSLLASNDLLAFTEADEWKISGSGDGGIISPLSVSAHCHTTIGSKSIQPQLANGHIIFVQAQGKKVYALSYDLNTDGYAGSEISVLSSHIFEWKTEKGNALIDKSIVDFAYQRIPDSLLWFALADGTAATCTYNPEHETIGWARHDSKYGKFKGFTVIPGSDYSVLFAVMLSENLEHIMSQRSRVKEMNFRDNASTFESALTTLRLNITGEGGNNYTSKKLISRLFISAIRSVEAWIMPAFNATKANNWERRRRITWDYSENLGDSNTQIDSGFTPDAAIRITTKQDQEGYLNLDEPLTIAAISPLVTVGG